MQDPYKHTIGAVHCKRIDKIKNNASSKEEIIANIQWQNLKVFSTTTRSISTKLGICSLGEGNSRSYK